MTIYDAAMIGLVLGGMIWGALRGITWQVASIASLVLGYTLAHSFSGTLSPHFPGEPVVARSLAMLAIYVGTSGGVFLAAWIVRATLRQLKFEAYDRHLGMLLGGFEGALLGLLGTLFVVSLAPNTRGPIFASPTGKVVGVVMSSVGPVLPAEARKVLTPFWSGAPAEEPVAETPVETEIADAPRITPLPAPPKAAARTRDQDAAPASLGQLIEEGEARIGRAIGDSAADALRKATGDDESGARIGRVLGETATQAIRKARGGEDEHAGKVERR